MNKMFHVFRAGEHSGTVYASDHAEAERQIRDLYGPAKWVVAVPDSAGPKGRELARIRSAALADAYHRTAGRGVADFRKEHVCLSFDPYVLEYFRRAGVGWQRRIHEALAEHVAQAKLKGVETSVPKEP
ncbi:BrnA antitoxin family protein [Cupriavidus pauculus]|uniref:Uncharacterized protein n=1 Tax=Cupriavidus pauculus TaxID=82633 RepID=A0A2N5CDW5_9BURK|nr:BrnA antitoxin family protein [Cupriavidus pauculus]PLQ00385.1 hypothetical protein CYJ10_12195 [Cupriavidus pauculus]